jgi:hypothetical protein
LAGAGEVHLINRLSRGCRYLAGRTASGCDFRQSEIENLGVSALGDEDIGRLDVAVDDSFGMGGIEGVGDFDGECENQFGFQRTIADPVLECKAVQKLHGDEGLAILFADVVDGANVGVIQRGRSLSFALKAGERLWVARNVIGKKLEGDEAMQPRVFRFIDDTHPTTAELLDDAIVGDGLADHIWAIEDRSAARLYSGGAVARQ